MARSGKGWVLGLAGACLLGALGAANAAGLRATADRSSPRIAGNSSDFSLVLANQGSTPLGNLRIRAPADVTIDCDGTTEGGRSFSPGGTLAAGDRVSCSGRSTTPANRARSMGFVVSAVDSQGLPQLQHVSLGGLGVTTPGQGVIVLMGGAIHNDTDVDGVLDAGETISYHYTLLNLGTLALSALAVSDLSGAVSCPQTTLAVGASLICTRTYTITASNATDGFVTNDVRVNGVDTLGLPVQGGDVLATISLAGNAGIHVFKSPLLLDDADTSGFASVGDRLRYTFVVKNSNAQTLTLVQLVEPDPTRIDTAISCAATTLGGLPFAGNGTGSLIANDVVLCTADYTIRVTDEAMGQALNLVEAGGTPAVGPRINASGASAVVIPGSFQIQVSKTANVADVFPGGTVIYTVVVSNPGSLPVANVNISDPLPAGVASFSWTCAGSSCPNASGSGGINETIPSFPAGAQVIYTVNAVLTMEPPPSILNVVTVTPPGVALCTPSNLPPPCRSTVPIRVVPFPIPAPAGSLGGWLLLSLLLGAVAAVRLRQEA